jgi:hypothetical protein
MRRDSLRLFVKRRSFCLKGLRWGRASLIASKLNFGRPLCTSPQPGSVLPPASRPGRPLAPLSAGGRWHRPRSPPSPKHHQAAGQLPPRRSIRQGLQRARFALALYQLFSSATGRFGPSCPADGPVAVHGACSKSSRMIDVALSAPRSNSTGSNSTYCQLSSSSIPAHTSASSTRFQ